MSGASFLQTRRLRLRGLRLQDAAALLELDASERVHGLLLDDRVTDANQALAVIIWARRFYAEHPGLGLWACERLDGGFVGMFSLMPLPGSGDVEIGVRLLSAHWGRGYPLEMGRALCVHAFDTLALPRLVGLIHPDNRGARLALERLGFSADALTTHCGRIAQRYLLEPAAFATAQSRRRWRSNDVAAAQPQAAAATASGG